MAAKLHDSFATLSCPEVLDASQELALLRSDSGGSFKTVPQSLLIQNSPFHPRARTRTHKHTHTHDRSIDQSVLHSDSVSQ